MAIEMSDNNRTRLKKVPKREMLMRMTPVHRKRRLFWSRLSFMKMGGSRFYGFTFLTQRTLRKSCLSADSLKMESQ